MFVVLNRIAVGYLTCVWNLVYSKAYWYFYPWRIIAQEEVETEITVMLKMSIWIIQEKKSIFLWIVITERD